jgi:hypothetical protein
MFLGGVHVRCTCVGYLTDSHFGAYHISTILRQKMIVSLIRVYMIYHWLWRGQLELHGRFQVSC